MFKRMSFSIVGMEVVYHWVIKCNSIGKGWGDKVRVKFGLMRALYNSPKITITMDLCMGGGFEL